MEMQTWRRVLKSYWLPPRPARVILMLKAQLMRTTTTTTIIIITTTTTTTTATADRRCIDGDGSSARSGRICCWIETTAARIPCKTIQKKGMETQIDKEIITNNT